VEAHDPARMRRLEGWQQDAAAELDELRKWREKAAPMIEEAHADLLYRRWRHAETVGRWSLGRVLLVTMLALYMAALQTVTVVLAVSHLWGG
jgi:hypothetical protein